MSGGTGRPGILTKGACPQARLDGGCIAKLGRKIGQLGAALPLGPYPFHVAARAKVCAPIRRDQSASANRNSIMRRSKRSCERKCGSHMRPLETLQSLALTTPPNSPSRLRHSSHSR